MMERYFAWKFYMEFVAPFVVIGTIAAVFSGMFVFDWLKKRLFK